MPFNVAITAIPEYCGIPAMKNMREYRCESDPLDEPLVESLSHCPFAAWPMFLAVGAFPLSVASMQQALYQIAAKQAEMVLLAAHQRRQMFFARGVHRWN
jgi:hypothetical protein